MSTHLSVVGIVLQGSGKEEDELTPLDRCLEREGIVKFSLKELQPGVRSREALQELRLRLIFCK